MIYPRDFTILHTSVLTHLEKLYIKALSSDYKTHSSVLAWRIPGTGEPGGLPSMGSHRVGHDQSDLAAYIVSFFCDLLLLINNLHNFKDFIDLYQSCSLQI